ncbi:MAG: DUF1016 domain-containing protein [Firmicutes bacterium]|nr:DUF1016 domain-containing protein [Bacillota bacterium]
MNYYNEIKTKLIENENYARIKDYSKERYKLNTYYEIGKILSKAGKRYGEGIIKEYSKKLTKELGKSYSLTTLKYIRQFYIFSKSHSVSDQLTYTHYKVLLSLKDNKAIDYYISLSISQQLSVRDLQRKIKSKEYERLDESAKQKLINQEQPTIQELIKNPLVIKNKFNKTILTEKTLKEIILENIDDFLVELGNKFSYIRSEYKIKIGDRYNYIDILLYNYEYNCFVVIELKVTELKKEHIGQIETYMNYIDTNLKTINQDKTIGIIICKKDNQFIMEYCSDPRILSREYLIKNY